jgi:hypothetical protein
MALMDEIRSGIRSGKIPPIFNRKDLKGASIEDPNHNLPNYDKKNRGSTNRNKKVLVSREIGGERYYTFDEQLFDD